MKLSHYAVAVLFLLPCLVPLTAAAADCNHPSAFASAQENFECAEKVRVATDQQLNDMVAKLLGTLRDDTRRNIKPHTDFLAAQQAWVSWRDAECNFRLSLSSGAPQWAKVNRSQCLTDLTAARVKKLVEYLQQAKSE